MHNPTINIYSRAVQSIARVAHENNRAYCQLLGDDSQVGFDEAPLWQIESACEGVANILSGKVTRPEQSHESWMASKLADGWKFGSVKDVEKKTHPCLVPFAELPQDQQFKDVLFFVTVQSIVQVENEQVAKEKAKGLGATGTDSPSLSERVRAMANANR